MLSFKMAVFCRRFVEVVGRINAPKKFRPDDKYLSAVERADVT